MSEFTRAVVRPPGANFAAGLTMASLGTPDYQKALAQHEAYCVALERCGLSLTRLEPDLRHPDSTFVEDTAILTSRLAILARPGAPGRQGEVDAIRPALLQFYPQPAEITQPGTVDGGDICEAGSHFFIGISERTNEEGAHQLAGLLAQQGYTATCIDIRGVPGLLHLKSGIAYLGDIRLVVVDALVRHPGFRDYELVRIDPAENYSANCLRVNEIVLLAAGFPGLLRTLQKLGYTAVALEMSEFQKMDGGLSCLSLRF